MVRKFALLAAASIAVAGCGATQPANSDDTEQVQREWRVDPDKVDSAALKAGVSDGAVRRFYEATGWKPLWTRERAQALLQALGESPRHALSRQMFLPASAPDDPSKVEAALTAAAIGYANALANGRVDPTKLREVYTVPRPQTDVVKGLQAAAAQSQLGQWLGSLAPQTPEYQAMSKAYLQYLQQADSGGAPTIRGGEAIHVGDTDRRVAALAEALRTNGYLPDEQQPPSESEEGQVYTEAMAGAVKRMQGDYGITSDGIVGEDTLEVLNTSPAARAQQLAVNMERLRWLERQPPATRIDVNTAAAMLEYWRDGSQVDRRRVVVGQPDWETPQLGSPIFQLVANPTWTVPDSIIEEEIADKGPGYLQENNMIRENGRIVQQPGPDNALGQVKFDMRNDEAIYLHDTPAKALFSESQRQRSHGCVRVQDAMGFARLLASDSDVLPAFDAALQTGDEKFVKLKREIPVRLMYHTVFADPGGRVRFRADPYGWDDDLAAALGLADRGRRKLRSRHGDIGP